MSNRVQNKTIIITGAAQGIGRACADLLAQEGANVVIGDIQAEKGAAAAEIRAAGGHAVFQQTDVTDEASCAALIDFAVASFGRLDGLVNNVGWFPRATLEETTAELWDNIININLRGAFFCCKYAVPQMRTGGGGSIVNVGSVHGIQGAANLVAYAAAKGGLLTMTRTLAGSCASDHIRVNYLIPGWVLTEGELALQQSLGHNQQELIEQGAGLRLGRNQTPLDSAFAVLFLMSDESNQITGIVLNVDAGHSTLIQ